MIQLEMAVPTVSNADCACNQPRVRIMQLSGTIPVINKECSSLMPMHSHTSLRRTAGMRRGATLQPHSHTTPCSDECLWNLLLHRCALSILIPRDVAHWRLAV